MLLQVAVLSEAASTYITYTFHVTGVHSSVHIKFAGVIKGLVANLTNKVFPACVYELVLLHVSQPHESSIAHIAHMVLFTMTLLVLLKPRDCCEPFVANVTDIVSDV